MSIQKLHYENLGGMLIRRDGLLNWRCPLCKAEGQSPEVMRACPECESKEATLPGAQPAPSVPEDVMRDARRYRWLRNDALDWYVGPEYSTYNDVVCSGECCNLAGTGAELDATIDAMLAAAPEAKP